METVPTAGVLRWRAAVSSLTTLRRLLEYADALADPDPADGDRLFAVIQMAVYFRGDPDVRAKLRHLRRLLRDVGWSEKLLDELQLTADRVYDWLTPSRLGGHTRWFGPAFGWTLCVAFGYVVADAAGGAGPAGLGRALRTPLGADTLIEWGGLYPPAVARGAASRWFSSILLHGGLLHLVSNLIPFATFVLPLERQYGTRRCVAVAVLAGLGGNLAAAVFEDGCTVVVGASGVLFGLAGFWIADLVVNFAELKRVYTRSACVLLFMLVFAVTAATQEHVSHFSHLGGLLAGGVPAVAFLPRFGRARLERWIPAVAVAFTAAFFTVMPVVAYTVTFPALACGA